MKTTPLLVILFAAILFVAINTLSGTAMRSGRIDLTENKLYTLSQGSKNIAASIGEPIKLQLYFSSKVANNQPTFKAYGQRVRELLEEYARHSGGKIRLEVIDPIPLTDAEDNAAASGLQGVMVSQGGERMYFGLVGTNSTDQQEILPFFDPTKEQFLEYDLTKLIYTLNTPKKPNVGLMSGLDIDGMGFDQFSRRPMPTQPWQIVNQMRQLYNVKRVEPSASTIPDDINVLVVVHPKGFSESAVYAIDQFVMRGGKLIAFVDPSCEADLPPNAKQDPLAGIKWQKTSSLNRITSAWGVTVPEDKVVGDQRAAISVNGGDQQRPEVIPFVVYLGMTRGAKDDEAAPKYFDSSDPVTGVLNTVNMGMSGFVDVAQGASVTVTPILRTSTDAMAVAQQAVQFMPQPKDLLKDFKSENRSFTLAARITGPVKSAFEKAPEAKPEPGQPAPEPPATPAAHLTESKGPIDAILVADVDMLSDRFWIQEDRLMGQILLGYRKFADNGDLLLGALDNLIGSKDLISVRARGEFNRPFTLVEKMQKVAREKSKAKIDETQKRIDEADAKLKDLQARAPQTGNLVLTPEMKTEIEGLQQTLAKARKEQRQIQAGLNADIDKLGTKLKIVNIAAVPILVCAFALGLGMFRMARRRAATGRN